MTSAFNMLFMPTSQILLYEKMNALSSRMAAAARARDWETLNRLARSVSALRITLMSNESQTFDEGCDDACLSEDDMQKKALLIQRILDDDAEIRRHTEPWMENVCCFLGSNVQRTQQTQQTQRLPRTATVTSHANGGVDPNLPRC